MSDTAHEVGDHGYTDDAEFHRMVASIDLTQPGMVERFKRWQRDDGTKTGLQRLLDGSEG